MPSSLFAATPAPTSLLSTAAPRRLSTRRAAAAAAAATAMEEAALLLRAAEVADLSAGLASPHPNFGCVVARSEKALGRGHGGGGGEGGGGGGGGMVEVVGEGFLYAQGTKCAELQAVEAAGELARGGVAYLNLEPGDCYGDHTAVSSLVQEFQELSSVSDTRCSTCEGKQYKP